MSVQNTDYDRGRSVMLPGERFWLRAEQLAVKETKARRKHALARR